MDVLFLSPHFPVDMPRFTRGLAEVGARVWGVGDQPFEALPEPCRRHLSGYLAVPRLLDEDDVSARVRAWLGRRTPDRIESLWEPLVLLAARLRAELGVEGMSPDVALGFRDKAVMKERVMAAGVRVPRAERATSGDAILAAAERVGFPLVVKPIAGAGSADTFRADTISDIEVRLPGLQHVPVVSVEEYIDGDEFTYDAVLVGGRVAYENVAQYFPRPIESRHLEWVSPAQITHRDLSRPDLQAGLQLGRAAIEALGGKGGFFHLEWFRRPDGEAVFSEVAARSGGGHLLDQMNYTSDIDLYREWARAVCWGAFEGGTTRRYACGAVFKRAQGQGRLLRYEGLERFVNRHRLGVCAVDFTPLGAPRRDWRNSLVGDGYVLFRHPDQSAAMAMLDEAVREIRLIAG